jgi:hypothetical protein
VASALKQNSGELHDMAFSAAKESFGKLLTKLLLSSDCYEHLSQFEELYKTLEEKGVALPTFAAPLQKLMTYNIETEASLGVEDVDLNAQRRFFTPQEYTSNGLVWILRLPQPLWSWRQLSPRKCPLIGLNRSTLHFWVNAVASALKQNSGELHDMAFSGSWRKRELSS